ncbi:MAG: methyltransferase domain-containing protein [Candidatus Lokiarchaeota archaeon]|nr:methyltransferase domain-containing protein [Candidatus Harpocratesius repetitus]
MNESKSISHNLSQRKKKEIQDRYNEESYIEIYDNRYKTLQKKKFSLISTKNINFNCMWFDLGCGTGLTWDLIISSQKKEKILSFHYIGCDLSNGMLLKFKSKWINHRFKNRKYKFNPHLVCADAENLPFRNDIILNIISLTTLQNLPDPIKGIKEIHRIIKKDANLITKIVISVLKKKYDFKLWKKWLSNVFLERNFKIEIIDYPFSPSIEDWIFYIESK